MTLNSVSMHRGGWNECQQTYSKLPEYTGECQSCSIKSVCLFVYFFNYYFLRFSKIVFCHRCRSVIILVINRSDVFSQKVSSLYSISSKDLNLLFCFCYAKVYGSRNKKCLATSLCYGIHARVPRGFCSKFNPSNSTSL